MKKITKGENGETKEILPKYPATVFIKGENFKWCIKTVRSFLFVRMCVKFIKTCS